MDNNIEERIVEEVQKYEHLYSPLTCTYKDAKITANSWRAISEAVGLDVPECSKTWRRIRDRFVRMKKSKGRSGDAGGQKDPAFYTSMSWLLPHIKHRECRSHCDNKQTESSDSAPEDSTVGPATRSRKRRRRTEPDQSSVSDVLSKLEERRRQVYRSLASVAPCPAPPPQDEFTSWGQTIGFMAKNLPKENQRAIMHQVYTLMTYNQPDHVPYVSQSWTSTADNEVGSSNLVLDQNNFVIPTVQHPQPSENHTRFRRIRPSPIVTDSE